jgi:ATP adenylyltransferase
MTYIQSNRVEACAFCTELTHPDSLENLIITRSKRTFVIVNRYPYTSGHLMVVPYDHQPSLELLDAETRAEMMEMTVQTMNVLRQV